MKQNNKRPLVFLISGVARAGKDTFAAALMEEMERNGCRVELFKFADALKTALGRTLEWIGVDDGKNKPMEIAYTENDEIKPYVRDALVSIGRLSRFCDKTVFARHLVTQVAGFIEFAPGDRRPVAVVADWRYSNEYTVARNCLDAEVVTVMIQRPGYEPANPEEEHSLFDITRLGLVMHSRMATDAVTLRGMAKETAKLYL